MKKILAFILITTFFVHLSPKISFAKYYSKERFFIVTAYYSPLPNQKHYLKWSYKEEIKLNWAWIKWASWKPVFSWMLAAPKWYKFGTKIYLKWLWVWEISDRWWAIVHAWKRGYKYDRIDLWVGYWEEWLKRALYWGKRKIKWRIVSKKSKITINYKKIPAPNWTVKNLNSIPSIFNKWIWVWSPKKLVIELKKFLKKIWLYSGKINWIYDSKLIDTIYNFQINNWIIKNSKNYWAWYWWRKTRNLILKKYLNWDFDKKFSKKISSKINNFFSTPIKTKKDIKKLQKILKDLNLYSWKIDWDYKKIKKIILNFQLKNKIIKSKNSIWAGYFWPKTRKKLKEIYNNFLKEQKRKIELEKKFNELNNIALKEAKKQIKKIEKIKYWDISPNVRILQKQLKKLWYFNYKDTAIFWKITREALIEYQLDKKIIKSKNDLWAWRIWPKTKEALKNDIKNLILKEKLKQNKILSDFIKNKKEIAINFNNL